MNSIPKCSTEFLYKYIYVYESRYVFDFFPLVFTHWMETIN